VAYSAAATLLLVQLGVLGSTELVVLSQVKLSYSTVTNNETRHSP